MRIHYLLTDLNGGGAALPVPELVALMREQGHSVRVLALLPKDRRACTLLANAGIEVTLLSQHPREAFSAARALLRVLDEDRPDLLWTSLTRATVYGGIAGRLRNIPVVSWQHNAWLKPATRWLLRATRSLTALWVADSRTVADYAAQALGVERSHFEIWPLFRARPDVALAQPCKSGERFRLGSLGRLHADKNFRHIVAAAALIRLQRPELAARIEFVIGGEGGEREALLAQIAAADLDNVRLVGFIDDTKSFLASLHGYLQPSHHEGLCIAAHEAMQAALPVIATRVGEMQHSVLPGVTGQLCAVDDVPALAAAIIELADHPTRAAALGKTGRTRVLAAFGDEAFRCAGTTALARAAALVTRNI